MALITEKIGGKKQIIGSNFAVKPEDGDQFVEYRDDRYVATWYRSGVYWTRAKKSAPVFHERLTGDRAFLLPIDLSNDLLLQDLSVSYWVNGKNDNRNYWEFQLYRVNSSFNWIDLGKVDSKSNTFNRLILNVNLQDKVLENQTIGYLLLVNKYKSPGALAFSGLLNYQEIRREN